MRLRGTTVLWLAALLLAAQTVVLAHPYRHLPAAHVAAHGADEAPDHAADLLCLDCVAGLSAAFLLPPAGRTPAAHPPARDLSPPDPGLLAHAAATRPRSRSPPLV